MNTPVAVALVLLLLFAGCTAPNRAIAPEPDTELILLTPLPPLSTYATGFGVKLRVLFHVLPDGSTKEVSYLRSSGDPEWDRSAADSLIRWRFTPVTGNMEPADRWIRYAIVVQAQEPVVMQLAEMVIPSQAKADSLFALLKDGADYDSLCVRALKGGTEGSWKAAESVNIARYPGHVREALCGMRPDQVVGPIRIGLNYVIFKRYRSTR
jgi:TonB family protein